MLRNLAISAVLGVGAVSAAHADVFRWVDDHGGVHYSDQWVPGSEVIKSSPKPPGGGGSYASTHSTSSPKSSPSSSSSQDNAAKDMKADLAKVRDQQCKDAKERYEKAIQARHIYKTPAPSDKAGAPKDAPEERQYLSDEEADAYRVKARQDMNELCGPSASK